MEVLEAVSTANHHRVILIDDEGAEDGIEILQKVSEVVVYRDPLEAVRSIEPDTCDYIITDLLMPEMNGSELLEELIEKGVQCPMFVRSSYFDSAEVSDRPFFVEHGIDVFDKHTLSSPKFYREVCRLVENDKDERSGLAIDVKAAEQHSVLDMPYDEFRALDQNDRHLLQRNARKALAKEIDAAFSSGAIWFLYGGRQGGHLTVNSFKDLPSRAEINKFCSDRQIPVLQFFKGAEIDDILLGWKDECSESTQYYPLVGLSGTGEKNDTLPVHFDTGSPVSFADFEILRALVSDLDSREEVDYVDFRINGADIKVTHEKVGLYLMDVSGATPKVEVTFIIPEDWLRFPNRQRVCGNGCKRKNEKRGPTCLVGYGRHDYEGRARYYCRYRWGLIGREFVIDNDLSFILDGKNKLMRLSRDK